MEDILALRIYQTIVGIIGILGNGLVCFVIFKVPALQTRTNSFLFQQAVVDFLGSSTILLRNEIPLPDALPDNALGWFLCYIWMSDNILFFLFITSTLNLLAVTMERYFAIVHPFKYQAAFFSYPRLKVGVILATCWILAAIIESYNMTIYEIQNQKCVSIAGSGPVVATFLSILEYALPVAVMLFAYIRTSVELRRGAARVGPGVSSGPATGMAESLLRARRNTFKTLMIVFITFMVCWTPNQFLFFLFNLGFPIRHNDWYVLITVAMVATNSCVNPVIYAFKYRQFRKGVRGIFCGKCRRGETSVVESTQASRTGP